METLEQKLITLQSELIALLNSKIESLEKTIEVQRELIDLLKKPAEKEYIPIQPWQPIGPNPWEPITPTYPWNPPIITCQDTVITTGTLTSNAPDKEFDVNDVASRLSGFLQCE